MHGTTQRYNITVNGNLVTDCIRTEEKMEIVCLDLEGVLVPEIWIAFAK